MGEKSLDRETEKAYLPPASPPRNHGHTTAAWTMILIMLVGSTIAAVGVVLLTAWLFWAGLAIVLVGAVVGRAMKMLGFGQPDLGSTSNTSGSDEDRGA